MSRFCHALPGAVLVTFGVSAVAHAEMPIATEYLLNCSGCHGATGTGVPEAGIPNLNDAGRYVGISIGREYLIKVPGLSQSTLDNATAAKLLNYVLHRFSSDRLPKDFEPYTTAEVAKFRGDKASDAEARRKVILAALKKSAAFDDTYETKTEATGLGNAKAGQAK